MLASQEEDAAHTGEAGSRELLEILAAGPQTQAQGRTQKSPRRKGAKEGVSAGGGW